MSTRQPLSRRPSPKQPFATKLHVFQGHNGQWSWRAKARNGEIISQSEGYSRRDSAQRGALRAHPGAVLEGSRG